jgi:glycerophosphoryl diester phosphodiesterase
MSRSASFRNRVHPFSGHSSGRSGRPLVFAHRGFSHLAPENTLPAFSLAAEAGADGIELDIHATTDGVLVVIHDHDIFRLTGSNGVVEDMTAEELRKKKVMPNSFPTYPGETIPYLSEVFETTGKTGKGKTMLWDIEIKYEGTRTTGLEKTLADTIHTYGVENRVLVSSFNPYLLRAFSRYAPEIPTAVIWSRHREVPFLLRYGVGRIISGAQVLKPESSLVTPLSVFRDTRILDQPVLCWTVNSEQEVRRVTGLGVDGIISDNPKMVIETLTDR